MAAQAVGEEEEDETVLRRYSKGISNVESLLALDKLRQVSLELFPHRVAYGANLSTRTVHGTVTGVPGKPIVEYTVDTALIQIRLLIVLIMDTNKKYFVKYNNTK